MENGSIVRSSSLQAALFSNHFSSVFVPSSPFSPDHLPLSSPFDVLVNIPPITDLSVTQAIKHLKSSKSCGLDHIPSFLVKGMADILAPILSNIFNKSLTSKIFPDSWNTAFIIPIFKTNDRSCVTNYRPISICNNFCKVFERVVHTFLAPILNPWLHPSQHGFRPSQSTTTNLVSFLSRVGPLVTAGRQIDVIGFDFVKAFDRVDHGLMAHKLISFHLHPCLVSWFYNYLTHRSCKVKVGSSLSSPYFPSSGVHQGSILGPLLFDIYIDDLARLLKCRFELFADDLRIWRPINDPSSSKLLQLDINDVYLWACANNMDLNPTKSFHLTLSPSPSKMSTISYNIANNPITIVPSCRDLGVLIDSKLRFHEHVTSIVTKAKRSLCIVLLTSHNLSIECLLTLYKAIVRPSLEYACPAWYVHSLCRIEEIEAIQRRFVRAVYCRYFYRKCYYSYDTMCDRLGLERLSLRRSAFEALFLSKSLAGLYVCEVVSESVSVLPESRAGRTLYISDLSPLNPLVRCVETLNPLLRNFLDVHKFLSLHLILAEMVGSN